MAIIANFPEALADLHHAWHEHSAHPTLPTRVHPPGSTGSGLEFLTFHRDFIRQFHAWYDNQPFADQAAVQPWVDVPSELKRSELGWDVWAADVDRIANHPETFASADELGQFIEGGVHNDFLHPAAAQVYNEPVLKTLHSPVSTHFYQIHGLVQNWWANWEGAKASPQRSTNDARSSVAVLGRDPSRNIKSLYAVTTTDRLAQIWDAEGWHIDFPAEAAGEIGLQFSGYPAVFGRDPARNTKSIYAITTDGKL
ncbi:hypothetical protein, partial [Streptomyces sp. NPDC006309]|uniref:hypothetical protein n=1 Tax=Streptomyces sp. NPDC006309 TaxID=3156749 RepID=UPI0033B25CC7